MKGSTAFKEIWLLVNTEFYFDLYH